MIEIREVTLFNNTVTAVLDITDKGTNILSLRKGYYSVHEWRTAKHHLQEGQTTVNFSLRDGRTEIINMMR